MSVMLHVNATSKFQFTHPRGVRFRGALFRAHEHVSIHAPARGAIIRCDNGDIFDCFNSRTREGCDSGFAANDPSFVFQFTHPRGVRCSAQCHLNIIIVSIHAPARGAIPALRQGKHVYTFQFTHPRGVRLPPIRASVTKNSFNSRTREGCDQMDFGK